jgi:glycosyltransferase involved in cell wall biosynthesis
MRGGEGRSGADREILAAPAPRVSVVLPARDGGAYLADAVASILAQSFADLELLLIDDGSRDGAVAALAPLAARDPRLRLLENPGAGLVAALNYGLGQARGELVARMDADDFARPERLARQVAFLDASPDVALVGAQVAFIDAAGAPTGERSRFPTAPAAVAAALAARGCVIRHPTIVARKAALLAAGGYRAPCEGAEDYDLWLRLSERARLANRNYPPPCHEGQSLNPCPHGSHRFAAAQQRAIDRAGAPAATA